MDKVLVVDFEKCTGCRECELACSIMHEGVSNPDRSRIKIIKWEWEGRYVPMTCQQCESAPCMEICPVKAISRDENLNRVMVDYDTCIGCRMCVAVCPFGAMKFDDRSKRVIKCDLCGGDPQCVRFCETDAIQYLDAGEQSAIKQKEAADKLYHVTKKADGTAVAAE
jgi:carbon-monoxide dehydrogenase iron sulfur subunit